MADRTLYDENSTPPVTGANYLAQTADHLKVLLDKLSLPVTSVSGTNTITGSVDPTFDGDGLVAGMTFQVTWAATNTAVAVTLNINSEGAKSVKEPDGSALSIGSLVSGATAMLLYTGSEFRMVSPSAKWIEANAAITPTAPTMQDFTASGTWTKPSGCRWVKVTVTGSGGGGTNDHGAGMAGATAIKFIGVSAISSATITIGAGGSGQSGTSQSAGNDSSWADGVNTVTGLGASATEETRVTGTGGDINLESGPLDEVSTPNIGAPSYWGHGGDQASGTGDNGVNPGSGGGEGTTTGGDGADGYILVEEFY